jgi:hypothetical protein
MSDSMEVSGYIYIHNNVGPSITDQVKVKVSVILRPTVSRHPSGTRDQLSSFSFNYF